MQFTTLWSEHCEHIEEVNVCISNERGVWLPFSSMTWLWPFPSRTGKTGRPGPWQVQTPACRFTQAAPPDGEFFFFLCVLKNTSERRWVSQELIRATGYRQIMCHRWSEFMHTERIIPAPIHLATLFFFIPHTNATVPTPLRWGAD